MVPPSTPLDLPALVALMYRADWTTLSLSATVTSFRDRGPRANHPGVRHAPLEPDLDAEPTVTEDSYQILLAPGGKYRTTYGDGGGYEVCDGETATRVHPGTPGAPGLAGMPRVRRRKVAALGDHLGDLRFPARLLSRFSLEMAGPVRAGGRPAYRLATKPRPLLSSGSRKPGARPDIEVRVLVDADTGLLLSYEELLEGQPVSRTELSDVRLDPPEAADDALFHAPPGLDEPDQPFTGPQAALPGLPGDAVRAAAGVAANAMGFALRHWPRASAPGETTVGPETSGPLDPGRLGPVSDEVINLLLRTGLAAPQFTAEVREWIDDRLLTAAISRLRPALPTALDGILGPDAVWDAFSARENSTDRASRLRLAGPGRYRIDALAGREPSAPETVGCDGERHWQVNGTRVTARRARPLPLDLARLVDPAWLLGVYRLWAGGETDVGGRRGLLVVGRRIEDEYGPLGPELFWKGAAADQVEVVVDAELAVLLRLTGFIDRQPSVSYEMREVAAGVADAHAFDVPPGAHSGGPFNGLGLTPAVAAKTAVKGAAGLGAASAAALVGWLQKRPRS
jgi:hypothetical protein